MARTGTYYAAILENRADFEGKVVGDIGAGSGILSLFAAQARRCVPGLERCVRMWHSRCICAILHSGRRTCKDGIVATYLLLACMRDWRRIQL